MNADELENLKKEFVDKFNRKFEAILTHKSNNPDQFEQLFENFNIWSEFLSQEANGIARDFVNELNSEKFKNYEKDDLESINNEFRSETIELIYSYNRQFLLGE